MAQNSSNIHHIVWYQMSTDHPPTREDFQRCLEDMLDDARKSGKSSIIVQSKELHIKVGGYPTPYNRMPICCSVMRSRMREGDKRLPDDLKNDGAKMRIHYQLTK